ncbi:MAG: cytochrome c [Nitrospirae bacterium]|nr:cytochrome c [Nitrospirota bacterium]
MRNVLISIALWTGLLGIPAHLISNDARAGDVGSQGTAQDSSTDTRPKRSSGDSNRGEELYQASCIVCHGARASGGIGPRLANNPVLSNDQAFWKIVYEGRHVMPPLKGAVTEQQMADIQAWLKTLR